MAAERDFELLDDYLANRLNPTERSEFEQKLNTDSLLKNEFDLQQRMVSSIKTARVAELKSMLNNIPVPPMHTPATVATKVALWTVMTALTGTGLYFYLNQSQEKSPVTEQVAVPVQDEDEKEKSSSTSEQPKQADTSNQNIEAESEPSSSTEQVQTQSGKPAKAKTDDNGGVSKQPVLDVFNPQDETENTAVKSEKVEPTTEAINKSSLQVDVDKNNRKYNFNYQYKNGKIILYGPFESNLYEIMEFFSDDKRTVFLYYKDNYYLLKDENESVNSLSPIKDQALIKKLKEYRGN
jgi:hypothetical protein